MPVLLPTPVASEGVLHTKWGPLQPSSSSRLLAQPGRPPQAGWQPPAQLTSASAEACDPHLRSVPLIVSLGEVRMAHHCGRHMALSLR